jgi:hypothetical protein
MKFILVSLLEQTGDVRSKAVTGRNQGVSEMLYEIQVISQTPLPSDIDLLHDNPRSAKCVSDYLRKQFPQAQLTVFRDGVKLAAAELDGDIESYDIQTVREEASRIPPTYRRGGGAESDDVATGIDGNPTKVWGPDNPEDRYD